MYFARPNDKSQDNTAKHLSFDELLHFKFIFNLLVKNSLKSVNI